MKFMFLASLGVALLAGRGLDRARLRLAPWGTLLPGLAVSALAVGLWAAPEGVARALATFPILADPAAQSVLRTVWPAAFLSSGVTALAVGVAATRGGLVSAGAAALLVLDLLLVNGDVNRFAPAHFYELRPDVRALMDRVPRDEAFRVFGYGIGNTPGLRFAPALLRENSDVWLYYLDRQVLFGRAPVLDGLEGALDEDRTAWAPLGSTLDPAERVPGRFRSIHPRLRQANVRWILSFAPLPADLVFERGILAMPEVLQPLRLSELRDPMPRAFFASDPATLQPVAAPPVEVNARGPHDIRLRARTPPGFVVLLSGWDAGWRARGGDGAPVALHRAGDRFIALPTPGGERTFHLHYRPRWWPPSLLLAAVGASLAVAALAAGRFRKKTDVDVGRAAAPE